MSIEEKLDWIFFKIKSGEFYEKDEQWIEKELYPVVMPIDFKLRLTYTTEWVQLLNKLHEDGLIADESADFKPFVLTLKGKMFEGYVKKKENEELERNRIRQIENTNVALAKQAVEIQERLEKLQVENVESQKSLIHLQRRIRNLTRWLTFAAILGALWYAVELTKFFYSLSHPPKFSPPSHSEF